jgi:hypothetical protein
MTPATYIRDISSMISDHEFLRDFSGDYDRDILMCAFVDALNETLPEGITVHGEGAVYADVHLADEVRWVDWEWLIYAVEWDRVVRHYVRRKAAEYGINLEPGDFDSNGYIDGMPAEEWLAAMTMD